MPLAWEAHKKEHETCCVCFDNAIKTVQQMCCDIHVCDKCASIMHHQCPVCDRTDLNRDTTCELCGKTVRWMTISFCGCNAMVCESCSVHTECCKDFEGNVICAHKECRLCFLLGTGPDWPCVCET